jgi:hypothetical protein
MRICGQDQESIEFLGERDNIVGKNGATTLREYSRSG